MDLPLLAHSLVAELGNQVVRAKRDGADIEKGVVLTTEWLEKNFDGVTHICQIFSAYPDIFVDIITPENSNFKLFFYQRIFLRACMRFKYHYVVAPRAFSKTFLSLLAEYLQCIFMPGTKRFICAPGKGQSAKIAKEKIHEIWDKLPLLKNEIVGDGNFGSDYVTLTFRNGSIFDVVAPLDSERGGRRNGGLIDEARDHDGETLGAIVLPLMNVSRRMVGGGVNEKEVNQQQLFIKPKGVVSL